MELYELVVLLHPDLEIDIDKPLKKLEKIISDQDGKIAKMDNWGKRKLAYPIQKGDYAIYIYYEVELDKQKVSKLDGILNITDEVIRHLLVRHVEPPEEKPESEEDTESSEEAKEEE